MLEAIVSLQISLKAYLLMFEFKRELHKEENIHSKDVRNHHRICDAQKHLLPGTSNLMEVSINQEISIE